MGRGRRGGHPCRLMKHIISHQSSSMRKSDDKTAETHMLHQLYSEENDTTKHGAVGGGISTSSQFNYLHCNVHGEHASPHAAGAESTMVHLARWHGVHASHYEKHAGVTQGGAAQSRTHSVVHVGFRPHCVMLVVDHLGPAHDVKVPHHVLLDVCQSGDLTEVPCKTHQSVSTAAAIYPKIII